jgi:hypothetical protein
MSPSSAAARRRDTPSVATAAMAPEVDALAAAIPGAATALRAYFRIADAWRLTADDQRTLLGRPAKTTFYRWRKGETGGVSLDTMERLSHILAIYASLHSIYVDHDRADLWVRRPNDAALFGGRTPVERLLLGRVADLYEVRRYLEAAAEPAL